MLNYFATYYSTWYQNLIWSKFFFAVLDSCAIWFLRSLIPVPSAPAQPGSYAACLLYSCSLHHLPPAQQLPSSSALLCSPFQHCVLLVSVFCVVGLVLPWHPHPVFCAARWPMVLLLVAALLFWLVHHLPSRLTASRQVVACMTQAFSIKLNKALCYRVSLCHILLLLTIPSAWVSPFFPYVLSIFVGCSLVVMIENKLKLYSIKSSARVENVPI